MKQILVWLILLALTTAHAQDAAVEERLNKLDGYVKDLLAAQADTQKRIAALAKELDNVREQNRNNDSTATQDDIKRLTAAVHDVDRKRIEDNQKIVGEIEKLAKAMAATPPSGRSTASSRERDSKPAGGETATAAIPTKGFEYVVQPNDTLSLIVQAYREQGIKLTVDQIVKANPGLNPNRMKVGQKLFIPAPEK